MEPKVETTKPERCRTAGRITGQTVAAPQVYSAANDVPWAAAGPTEAVLLSLAKVVEQRDNHTAGHCERLAFTGVALGVAMRLDSRHLLSLYLGGYLHDVGKVGIPDSILFKPGGLSDQEWETMRTHPVRGEEICRPLKSLKPVLPLIRHHHERLDGTGYPDGLRGSDVPLLARVLQVVDIYDALTNPRPYKQAYPRPKALEILEEEAERGWRDREVTSLFVRMHKRMHAKISEYRPGPSGSRAPTMSQSLANLQSFLARA
jgi:putative two-component system response regulator